jgi:zinc protease
MHTTGFSGRALIEDLDLLLEILVECLRMPLFPDQYVERLRALLLTNLAIRSQDTAQMASMTFDQIIYQGHPYSRPEDGYENTIQEITREDLRAFHHNFFGPGGMVIAIVGSIEPEMALDKIEEAFGDWQETDQTVRSELPKLTEMNGLIRRNEKILGKSQADIVLGAVGPRRNDPDYIAAALGNNILGQFGLYGRIGREVREREGLAYYAYSDLHGGIGPGHWCVYAGVEPGNIEKTIEIIQKELRKIIQEPVLKEELEDSKSNIIGGLPISLESNAGVAGALLNLERYHLGLNYYQKYGEMINSISIDDVMAAANRFLGTQRIGIAVAGP